MQRVCNGFRPGIPCKSPLPGRAAWTELDLRIDGPASDGATAFLALDHPGLGQP